MRRARHSLLYVEESKWFLRRIGIFGTLIFCGVLIGYLALYGEDTELNRSIANGLLLLAGVVTNGYIFGAVIDDRGRMNAQSLLSQMVDADAPPPASSSVEAPPQGYSND